MKIIESGNVNFSRFETELKSIKQTASFGRQHGFELIGGGDLYTTVEALLTRLVSDNAEEHLSDLSNVELEQYVDRMKQIIQCADDLSNKAIALQTAAQQCKDLVKQIKVELENEIDTYISIQSL